MNIYVGNLPFDATEDEVRELFAGYGQVTAVTLIKDKFTGQARGFGFVEMGNVAEAQKAIQELNGKPFKNRNMVVNPARPREERTGGGGGFSDRGGYSDRGGFSGRGGGGGGGGYSSDRRGPGGSSNRGGQGGNRGGGGGGRGGW